MDFLSNGNIESVLVLYRSVIDKLSSSDILMAVPMVSKFSV